MKRLLFAALLTITATPAIAWVPCNQAGITAPVAIRREAPGYPPAVREIGVEGSVEVALTVLRDGRVGWVRVVRAEPPGYFEQAAIAGVRHWRFTPARAHGEPVECRMTTRVRFTLADTVDPASRARDADQPDPIYPPALLAGRVEGYAEVEFERTADGQVRNARVILAMPRGAFESAALEAIRRWRIEAPPEGVKRLTRRFEFRLPDSSLAQMPPTTLASAHFPMSACERRIAGRVALELQTDATGAVLEARILSATPAGVFDDTALAIARASRLTPAYRNGAPVAATALLTLFLDPEQATCPHRSIDPVPAPAKRPAPQVTRHDERPAPRADRLAALSGERVRQVP